MVEWRPIPGFPKYEVSSNGDIYRNKRVLKPCPCKNGYLYVNLWVEGRRKFVLIHRLVMLAFVGEAPGKEVDHLNNNKHDNRLENLEWVEHSENQLRAYRRGRARPYQLNPHRSNA